NPDLLPTPVEERTWTWWTYSALWMGMVHSVYNFTWIGGLIGVMGMSVWQALAVAITGNIIQTILMGLNGRVGARHGIPFAVWSRSAFGVFGSNVPAIARGIVAIGWFGVQSFLGATAINVLLEVTVHSWKAMGQSSILGAPTNLMLAMIIYWAINIVVVYKGMDAIRRFENWAGPMVFVVLAVLLVYSINAAHGIGPVFQTPSKYHTLGGFMLKGFFPMVAVYISGSWATMVLNIPDLTRFARSNKEQFWGTMIGLPIATLVFYCMASIVVSSCIVLFGKAIWNPSDILIAINNPYLSIFGATLLAIATISVNIPANIVSPAYDLTNLLPKIFNFKSGAITAMILGFIYMPWKLMENPAVLYSILNNIGALLGPATGIIIADFFFVRKQHLDVPELFKVNGRYRYNNGFSSVALGVLIVSAAICIIGEFVPSVKWLYDYSWFIGLVLGFIAYLVVVKVISSGKGGVPEAYQPIGSLGSEHVEVAAGQKN
ncbi:MAG TPA: NCS1 family nucleobase:cation symporter-1, partial [Syntrophomonadaceae bacterium]|nr:NCS1 family nucleobase:cation symporter-1 [Syntrophomonadaceae bacterium]